MSNTVLYVGTGYGLFKAEGNGQGYKTTPLGLEDAGGMRCPVMIDKDDPKRLYAGTTRGGMLVSEDSGQTWRAINNGLDKKEIWWAAQHPKTGDLWAGVSPSAMYKSSDRGASWTECEQLQSLPTIKEWTFPQPPHISHVKHLSLREDDPDHVMGAVEEGWLIRSTDGGHTWENLRNGCEFDAHTVYYMPDNPNVVISTSGQGVYRSEDGGDSFTKMEAGMDRRYMTHLVVHPDRPNVMFTAAAEVPPPGWLRPEGGNSAFYRSDDQGHSWRRLTGGLPEHIK
ncbi:MAG TPA: exo-alpha-sialidase, partial [Chloroflexota bacterium]|nr:exo-alpha-sialidase [Chloroflexota bacterium]